MRVLGAVLLAASTLIATRGVAQQQPPAVPVRRSAVCRFQLEYVGREGRQVILGVDTTYYAGGGVRLA